MAKILRSRTPDETFVFGAVYIHFAPESYLKFSRDFDRLRQLPGYLAVREFTNPPHSRYAALFISRLYSDGRLEFLNCGHVPPLLISNGTITYLEGVSFPVGAIPEVQFDGVSQMILKPNDRVVIVTDGVTEAMNAKDEEFGIERVGRACLSRGPGSIGDALRQFVAESPQADDYLMCDLTYRG